MSATLSCGVAVCPACRRAQGAEAAGAALDEAKGGGRTGWGYGTRAFLGRGVADLRAVAAVVAGVDAAVALGAGVGAGGPVRIHVAEDAEVAGGVAGLRGQHRRRREQHTESELESCLAHGCFSFHCCTPRLLPRLHGQDE